MIEPLAVEPRPSWAVRVVTALWDYLVGSHGFALSPSARTRMALFLVALMGAASWGTWKLLQVFAVLNPNPDSPAWEIALQARLVAFRLKVGLGLALGALFLAWATFLALDRTRLGKRLWHWSDVDNPQTAAAKTLAAGLAFPALLIAFAILAAQVLR